MSLANAIKSNTLDPRRFIGRHGRRCSKCGGLWHYVNRFGGVQCESCSPPGDGDALLRIAFREGRWSDGLPVDSGRDVESNGRSTGNGRRQGRSFVAERLRWLAQPLGADDYAAALAWAEKDDVVIGAPVMDLDLDLDLDLELGGIGLQLEGLADLPLHPSIDDLSGKLVRLTRPVPCFGGTWPVGAVFTVSGWASGPFWNLSYAGTKRGICACPRDRFEIVEFGDFLSDD